MFAGAKRPSQGKKAARGSGSLAVVARGRFFAAVAECLSLALFDLFGDQRHDFEQVADDAIIGLGKDWRFGILVNGDDDF